MNQAIASPDPEVARRAKGLAREIGYRLDCTRLLTGTPVRLNFTNAPLSDVLASLSAQSEYAVGVSRLAPNPTDIKVTVRTDTVPFWKAIEEVSQSAGLAVAGQGTDISGARFFVPEVPAVPTTAGEKLRRPGLPRLRV